MNQPRPQRRVVCAANLHPDGTLLLGARHWDHLMNSQRERLKTYLMAHQFEQGFIDQFGVFMTREEAWQVAEAAGQILRRCGGDGTELFSENLY